MELVCSHDNKKKDIEFIERYKVEDKKLWLALRNYYPLMKCIIRIIPLINWFLIAYGNADFQRIFTK